MNRFILVIILLIITSGNCLAKEQNAFSISTTGKGSIEVVKWGIGIIISNRYDAFIPKYIEEGQYVQVSYIKDDERVFAKIPADCIKYRERDNMCWVYSRCKDASKDTLYIEGCRPIKLYP